MRTVLLFASIVEIATGLALMFDPVIVVTLLVGANAWGAGMPLARFPGIALLALGIACWPRGPSVGAHRPACLAMLIYNALVAAFLAWLGLVGHLGGVLLWPAAALHAVVALWMALAWRAGPGGGRPATADRMSR
jgi:hypothetical protein